MRRGLALWAIALVFPFAHFFLQVGLGIGVWAPDLLVVALLLVARELRTGRAAALGFAFGLMEDAFSILSFGANTLTLTFLGILGAQSRDLFVGESVLFYLAYLALGTWLRYAIPWVLTEEGIRGAAGQVLLVQGPIAAAYAAGVGVLVLGFAGLLGEGAK